jgi:MoaA/NifB/PqqE/SkfB family radical SAM enzyme
MNNHPITEAQIFLTRRCQLSCQGCQVVRGRATAIREMSDTDWEAAANRMKHLGIQTVKILGGEPTLHPSLPRLTRRLAFHGIKVGLLTNGIGLVDENGEYSKKYSTLVKYLHAVFPSIDAKKSPFVRKNAPGWQVIEWAKTGGIPLIGANVSIGKLNLGEVVGVVKELHEAGVRVNLSAYNYLREGQDQADFDFRMEVPSPLKWEGTEEEMGRFQAVMEELCEYADSIAGGKKHLQRIARYGIGQSWACSSSDQLRLDANGDVMLCLDRQMQYPLNILSGWGWDEYHTHWAIERNARLQDCSCAWSSPMLAEQRRISGVFDMEPGKV